MKKRITAALAALWLLATAAFADSGYCYRYWFDSDDANAASGSADATAGTMTLDASALSPGLHTLCFQAQNAADVWGSPATRLFVVTTAGATATYWFDSEATRHELPLGQSEIATDGLTDGLHSVNVQIAVGDVMSTPMTKLFIKVPTNSFATDGKARIVIDGKVHSEVAAAATGGLLSIDADVATLPTGLHTLALYLVDRKGNATPAVSKMFYKVPIGGEGVKAYEYWVNDDRDNAVSVTLPEVANPFSLLTDLDVAEQPLRSLHYTFDVVDGIPTVYARNDLHIMLKDAATGWSLFNGEFTDVRVKQAVEADLLKPGRTTVPTIEENAINWHYFAGTVGNTVSLQLDRAAYYELYSPTAAPVIASSGTDATAVATATLSESGTYYLAVHDITASSKSNLVIYFEHNAEPAGDNPGDSGITTVAAEELDPADCYNLQGIKVDPQNVHGTIVISNGRKIYVK